MGFLDYPFVKKEIGDPTDFPGREEVLRFLDDFASDFGLVELTVLSMMWFGLSKLMEEEMSRLWSGGLGSGNWILRSLRLW